jgi:electron-transferring-flavoprotein dehydrogenase
MTRDSMTVDIVCVGAGVASLATALRLLRRIGAEGGSRKPPQVVIFEKGAQVGAHVLSGAVLDPESLLELLTAEEFAALPVESRVKSEAMFRLTGRRAIRLPWIPPLMRNRGMPLVSLTKLTQYLGRLCEAAGAEIYTGFPAAELLRSDGRVTGVRIGDKGVDKQGGHKPNYEPGPHVEAKAVVLGEGPCGMLTEHLIAEDGLAGFNPQSYALGIKELLEIPVRPGLAGTILHTFGYPHDPHTYGGGFLYCLSDTQVAVGLVTALDYRDPELNPHDAFRAFKAHPLIQSYIVGGRVVGYGAKMLPEGGLNSVPALVSDGVLVVGDGAGLLDSLRLKGIHIAIQSGIAAGDALFEGWKNGDFSASALGAYPRRFQAMSGWRQMKRVRNVRACFALGTLPGMMGAGLSAFTGGLLPPGRFRLRPDHEGMRARTGNGKGLEVSPADQALQMDRLSDLYHSGTRHEEDQPCHLRIPDPERCWKECIPEYGAPCRLFCPAQVYRLDEDGRTIRMDASNCLHCGTCEVKDPLRNIEWHLPEGEGGPRYAGM